MGISHRRAKNHRLPMIDGARVIRDALFAAVTDRDGGCCVWCRRRVERIRIKAGQCPPHMATLDHVIPQVRGGVFARVNLVLACNACNHDRGSTPALAYAERRGVTLPEEVLAALGEGAE